MAPAKSARMNCGMLAMLPFPPCNWAIFAASAEAAEAYFEQVLPAAPTAGSRRSSALTPEPQAGPGTVGVRVLAGWPRRPRWTPRLRPRSATSPPTAMTRHIPKSTSRMAPAKSARMNCGMAATLPFPPCNWAIFAASAEAAASS